MRRIPLHRKDGTIRAYALVDDEDYESLARHRWCVQGRGYPARRLGPRGAQETIYMHQVVMGSKWVDHIDNNPLNNTRGNLRLATNAENQQNRRCGWGSSGVRGVIRSGNGTWVARVVLGGRKHHLGTFDTVAEAAATASAFRAQHMPFSEDARLAA